MSNRILLLPLFLIVVLMTTNLSAQNDLQSMKYRFIKTDFPVASFDIDHKNNVMIVGCRNGQVQLIDLKSGKVTHTQGKKRSNDDEYYQHSAVSVIFLPDHRHFLTTERYETLSVWDMKTYKKKLEIKQNYGMMAVHPDGQHILLSLKNGDISRMETKTLRTSAYMNDCYFREIDFSKDGSRFATNSFEHNKMISGITKQANGYPPVSLITAV